MFNDISFDRPKRSGAKTFWAVFLTVIIMALASYGAYYYYLTPKYANEKKNMQSQIDQLNQQIADQKKASGSTASTKSTAAATTSNNLVYNDSTYGFSITFNEKWTGWKVKPVKLDGITATYYFEVPTTDTSWGSGETNDSGYSSVFAVSVWTKAEWEQTLSDPVQAEIKITEIDEYVFSWSSAQAGPEDILDKGLLDDIKNVITTFKLN